MRINLDDSFFTDPRIAALASFANEEIYTAMGRLTKLWWFCSNQRKYVLSAREVEIWTGHLGSAGDYAEFMTGASLAEKTEDGYRISGVAERITYLDAFERGRSAGGKARAAAARDDKGRLVSSRDAGENQLQLDKSPAGTSNTSCSSSSSPSSSSSVSSSTSDSKTKSYRKSPSAPAAAGKSVPVWSSYSEAYKKRWGVEPLRNAQQNALACKLVDKLGEDIAPKVTEFFCRHRDRLYTNAKHPLTLLVRDAEKIYTEWATGRMSTSGEAQQEDRTMTNLNAAADFIREASND